MSMETLNSSVGSLVEESLFAEMDDAEVLRRISPYATLRPGDLSALVGLQHQTRSLHSVKSAALLAEAIAERSDGDNDGEKETSEPEGRDFVVRGQDIGDLPAEYKVCGLRAHEMPVIDANLNLVSKSKIIPGFHYHVRHAGRGSTRYLFEGKAMTLQSIGLGYGKRLTFNSESVNFNDNYFWSDSDPNGFGFSLEAVKVGDILNIYSAGSGVIGEVKVEQVHGPQEEVSSEVVNGDVVKKVKVTMRCSVTYHYHSRGRIDYKLHDFETLSGVASVIKKRRSRVAALDSIHNVRLARSNESCTLQVES